MPDNTDKVVFTVRCSKRDAETIRLDAQETRRSISDYFIYAALAFAKARGGRSPFTHKP